MASATQGSDATLVINNVTKVYQMGEQAVHALKGVSLTINAGEYVAIMGPSGSGKSTLMNMIGCLDVPTAGTYLLEGQSGGEMSEGQLATICSEEIGFVC